MNLFEIQREIQNCIKPVVDERTGEIIGQEIDFQRLDELEMDKETKIRNIACWMKNLAADEKALDEQEKVFAARKRGVKNTREGLKNYLAAFLQGEGMKRAEFVISFRGTKSTNILNEEAIPEQYKIPQPAKVSKEDILRDLKAGIEVPGAELKESLSMTVK